MKYIIDTDPGHDDAMAIMLAIKSSLPVMGITTVCGNSTIENTTRNTRYITSLLRTSIPVYSGAEKPIARDLVKAVVHGESGLDGIDPTNDPQLTHDAVDQIIRMVESEDAVTIITLGPLTNIALAMQKSPDVMKKVREIIMMGGAIKVAGNKNRVAEFNIFVDPEAADVVLRFPIKRTLIPLDACNHVQLHLEDFEQITNKEIREPLIAMVKPYMANIAADEGTHAAMMYDPLTVYYVLNPDACTVKQYDVVVETTGEHTRGMTVADLRNKPLNQNVINVVEHISAEAFTKDFIRYLNS